METHNSFFAMIMDGMKNAPLMPELPKPPVREHTPQENMNLLLQHKKPYYVPIGADNNLVIPDVVLERPALNKGGRDWFGVEWEYVPGINAPSIKPGFVLFEEIEDWEETLKFPDLDAIDWEKNAKLLAPELKPGKNNSFVLFNGCFERIHSLMGFENALVAMATEPEETLRLFQALADYKIALIDKLVQYYPVDTIVYHDDWGAQKSTFFSVPMFKELLYEPTRRIVEHVHSLGKNFTMHCCGRVETLVPYMLEMGVDSWESAQMDINDLPALRKQYGSKLSMEVVPKMPALMNPSATEEEVRSAMRDFIVTLAKDGPMIITRLACCPATAYWVYDEYYKVADSIYKDAPEWE